VTDTFLPQINGIATYVANIAEEFGKKGHEVLVIAPKTDHADRKSFKAKNVTVCEVASVPVDFIYTEFKVPVMGLPKVLLALKEFRPDIIHFQMPLPLGIDSILTSKVLNVPLVATLHTFMTTPDYLLAVIPEKLVNKSVTDFLPHIVYEFYHIIEPPRQTLV
jgi:phosphatidylinositol alpha 1,6-mannosyltransferase